MGGVDICLLNMMQSSAMPRAKDRFLRNRTRDFQFGAERAYQEATQALTLRVRVRVIQRDARVRVRVTQQNVRVRVRVIKVIN